MSSAERLLGELGRRCRGGHLHGALLGGGRAGRAAVYPPGLVKAILRGVQKQLEQDRMMPEVGKLARSELGENRPCRVLLSVWVVDQPVSKFVDLDWRSQCLRPRVVWRRTADLDTGEVLEDVLVASMCRNELSRKLDRPRKLRVEFFGEPKTVPSSTGCWARALAPGWAARDGGLESSSLDAGGKEGAQSRGCAGGLQSSAMPASRCIDKIVYASVYCMCEPQEPQGPGAAAAAGSAGAAGTAGEAAGSAGAAGAAPTAAHA